MGRHGESVFKRKDGRWEARFIASYDENGKAHYRSVYARSYQEVKFKRLEAALELSPSKNRSNSTTQNCVLFAEASEKWLISRQIVVKSSTYAHYDRVIRKHLLPELGNLQIDELDGAKLQQFINQKLSQGRLDGTAGLSAKTVSDIWAVLKLILEFAGASADSIKCVRVPAAAKGRNSIQVLSRAEQEKLERFLQLGDDPFALGVLLSMYTGIRIGELCALQWKDIDFAKGVLAVRKTVIRIEDTANCSEKKTKLLVEPPKTACSNRDIPLPDGVLSYLKPFQKAEDVYILSGTSRLIEPRVCLSRYKTLLRHAGIEDYSFHALRHTFATRCVENQMDIKSLSEIMGHSSVTITMQRYVHPTIEMKRQQMNRIACNLIHGQLNSV